MRNPLEYLANMTPSNKAGFVATSLILFGVLHEIGGYQVKEGMAYIAIGLGLVFLLVCLLLLYKPPPSQNRRKGDRPENQD